MIKNLLKTIKILFFDFILAPEFLYRLWLRFKYGVQKPSANPNILEGNRALKTDKELMVFIQHINKLGLPLRSDRTKNWDTLIALDCILKNTNRNSRILDGGAEIYSMLLPWLFLYGYRNLTGINLVFKKRKRRGPIVYTYGDITRTEYEDNTFDAITCLSVIEHGVKLGLYFKEMSRILKPGGILITSTDYYETPIDTHNYHEYSAPIKVFSKEEIREMFKIAEESDLILNGPVDLKCEEKPVNWERLNLQYTYLIFVLKKSKYKSFIST